jgi:Pyruvate/2-oxoacid:ferredoxin oxidoreductase gamma subunit
MLGYLCAAQEWISAEALEQAIRTTVKEKTIDLNLKAFMKGRERAAAREIAG